MKGCLYIENLGGGEFTVILVEDRHVPVWHTKHSCIRRDEAFRKALRIAAEYGLFGEARRILDAWERGDDDLPLTADIQARENAIAGVQ